ncbi:uncharacterized protein A4U43_C05F19720 [Asparagus officinalis]|uniref:KIB1-4 beta-propeller domain-containing protein n=2 Tax=Asparagus officinalis TaxID=4686 RepID=A0A5P1ET40_ASPOF|nr:uncharacterized protein A4U43_C05F19720 [Asparagus officinalis]
MFRTVDFWAYNLEAVDEPIKRSGAHYITFDNRSIKRGNFGFKWVEMGSLGDQALFLGKSHSLCVPAVEYRGCQLNCIYFTEHGSKNRHIPRGHSADGETDRYSICDMGIYDWEDGTFQRFSQLNINYHVPPIWLTSNK